MKCDTEKKLLSQIRKLDWLDFNSNPPSARRIYRAQISTETKQREISSYSNSWYYVHTQAAWKRNEDADEDCSFDGCFGPTFGHRSWSRVPVFPGVVCPPQLGLFSQLRRRWSNIGKLWPSGSLPVRLIFFPMHITTLQSNEWQSWVSKVLAIPL